MIRKRLALALAAPLLATAAAVAQREAPSRREPAGPVAFTKVRGQPETGPSSFLFLADGYEYEITDNGRGSRARAGSPASFFDLRLARGEFLDTFLYHTEHRGDLLLACQVGDGESAAGFAARLDGRTLRVQWKRSIPAFNVGQPLMEGDYAYLTALGFVAKINLRTGAYVWRHDNLYRRGDTFNSFELPRVEGDAVTFTERPVRNTPAKKVIVQKLSGKIIRQT